MLSGGCAQKLCLLPAECLARLLDVGDDLLREGFRIGVDDHDGAEGFLRVVLEEPLDVRCALHGRLDAVVGVDAEEAEREGGVEAFLVRPLGARERVGHVLDGVARGLRDAAEDGRGARVDLRAYERGVACR